MKTFKYNLFHIIKSRIKTIHERLTSTTEFMLNSVSEDRNIYQMFGDWITEIVQYGTLLSLSLSLFVGFSFKSVLMIVPLGLIRWLFFDTIRNIKHNIK